MHGPRVLELVYGIECPCNVSYCTTTDLVTAKLDLILNGWDEIELGVWVKNNEMMLLNHPEDPTLGIYTAQWELNSSGTLTCYRPDCTSRVSISFELAFQLHTSIMDVNILTLHLLLALSKILPRNEIDVEYIRRAYDSCVSKLEYMTY